MSEVLFSRVRCRLPRIRQLNKRHLLVGSGASKSGIKISNSEHANAVSSADG